MAESQADIPAGLPSTAAGIYGYLGYEMVRLMERLPDRHDRGLETPDALLMRPTMLAVFDTVKDELYLTSPVYVRTGVTARQAYEGAQGKIDDAKACFTSAAKEEKALGYREPPNYIRPVGETEGAAMLAAGKWAEAKLAF